MTFGWHPRDHKAALDGMLMLTLEERGAYNTCLDLIYDRGGPIQDDGRWLAGWMGVSLRRWNSLRASLIVKGKLFALNLNGVDCLMNHRAAIELENQSKRARKLSESGAKGGRNRAENEKKASENNAEGQARLEATLKLKTETQTETEDTPSEPNGSAAPKGAAPPKAKDRRSRFVPDAWAPTELDMAYAGKLGFTPGEIERELAKFRRHEFARPYSHWSRTFQSWLDRAAERRHRHDRPDHATAKLDAKQANYERAWTGSERAARYRGEP
jgi:uncharacterized protein YdaU (DUF1376 family)